jgi:hypothetical protein
MFLRHGTSPVKRKHGLSFIHITSPHAFQHTLIFCLRVGSVTSSWFGFRHQAHVANMYISLTLGLSVAIVFLLLKPNADGPKAAKWRLDCFPR